MYYLSVCKSLHFESVALMANLVMVLAMDLRTCRIDMVLLFKLENNYFGMLNNFAQISQIPLFIITIIK